MSELVTVVHMLCGAAFAVTLVIMQLGVGPAMGKILPSPGKEHAVKIIHGRIRLSTDIIIILMIATATYLLMVKQEIIFWSIWLQVKITLGGLAIIIGALLHFYWRGKKRKLKKAGKDDEHKALTKRTLMYEKVVLVLANFAWIMAVFYNHFI